MKVCQACSHRFEGPAWACPACGRSPQERGGHLALAPALAEESAGFEADFFTRLADVEPGNFWFESRNRLLVWALQRYFPRMTSFLEIGCGTGFVLAGIRCSFPAAALSGSEIFAAGLAFAQNRMPQVSLFQMDARDIPFVDEFDVIGAFDVLEHISDDELVLSQMLRAVKPGGGVILTVPQHPWLWSAADTYSHHQRRYTRREMEEKATRAGFRITRITSFVSLLLPLMLLSRRRQNKGLDAYDPRLEFDLNRTLNRALEQVLSFERTIIRGGGSLPAGGSLLVVAKRPLH